MEKINESLKLNEKYIDPRSLQKRGFTSKQLKENRPLKENGKFSNSDGGPKNNGNGSEKKQ